MIPELDASSNAAKLLVRFRLHPVKDEKASRLEGRLVAKDVEYIEIRVPGQRDTVDRPVRESDKVEYGAAYQAWKANAASGGMLGTPLSELPGIAKSQVLELEYFGCRTVEQLAGMSDAALKNVGPILDLRTKAQAWLKVAKDNAHFDQFAAALKEKDGEIDALKKQMKDLVERFEAKDKPKK